MKNLNLIKSLIALLIIIAFFSLPSQALAPWAGLWGKVRGVLIQSVNEGGAGNEAELKQGDVILSVNGVEVNAANELQTQIASHHPGDVVTLKIFSNKKEMEKKVKLKSRPNELLSADDSKPKEEKRSEEDSPATASFDKLGLTVKGLSAKEKRDLEIEKGVKITGVDPVSEAGKRALAREDIIMEADGEEIYSPSELEEILAKRKGDSILLRVKKKSSGQVNLVAIEIPR